MFQCYLCKSKKLKTIRKTIRHNIKRDVLECQNCGLVFLEPKKENLQNWYKKDYRKTHSPIINKALSSKAIFDLYYPLQGSRVERVKKYLGKNKKVLDIGCSAGHFLYAIKNQVKECIGIEFNLDNAKFVNKKLGIKCYTEPIEKTDLPKKYFDVIFCWQTLEHIEDPVKFLKTAKEYLKDNGIIFVMVPNLNDPILAVYQIPEYEDFYYRTSHLFYYSAKTLNRLMKQAGFSGKIVPFQWYNFLNNLHWHHLHAPQKSSGEGLSEPRLITNDKNQLKIKKDLNAWVKKIDEEYKSILEKHFVSDQMGFVGRKN